MLQIGKINTLKILKAVDFGMYLIDKENPETEILLPLKYVPVSAQIGSNISVFLYTDSEDRLIATTLKPFALAEEFAFLKVIDESAAGSFLDMGIAKDVLVPRREQSMPMKVGQSYIVYVYEDELTNRLVASSKWLSFIVRDPLQVIEGQEVDLLIAERTDLGYNAIINHLHVGLLYFNEVFRPLQNGDRLKGYVKKIREGNKIDLSLQKQGYAHVEESGVPVLLEVLMKNNLVLPIGDKSDPALVYEYVQMSKKNFKKAAGALLKMGQISISDHEIRLLS